MSGTPLSGKRHRLAEGRLIFPCAADRFFVRRFSFWGISGKAREILRLCTDGLTDGRLHAELQVQSVSGFTKLPEPMRTMRQRESEVVEQVYRRRKSSSDRDGNCCFFMRKGGFMRTGKKKKALICFDVYSRMIGRSSITPILKRDLPRSTRNAAAGLMTSGRTDP